MQIKFKKLNKDAIMPKFAKVGDAGLDLVATEFFVDEWGNYCYKTGLTWEAPIGIVGLICPRSSVTKYDLILANSVGVLDTGYRGEILIKFKKIKQVDSKGNTENVYKVGDKVAQLVILALPKIEIVEVDELGVSERGEGGFGSTGR